MARLNDTKAIADKPLQRGCPTYAEEREGWGPASPNAGAACTAENSPRSPRYGNNAGPEKLRYATMHLDGGVMRRGKGDSR